MKSRKIISFLAAVVCFLMPLAGYAEAMASETASVDAGEAAKSTSGSADAEAKTSFSLEESINTALLNNVNLKLSRQEYENARVELDQAKFESKQMADIRDDKILRDYVSTAFSFEGAQVKDLAPRLKEANELIAKKNLALDEQNLRIEVEEAYFSVLKARDNLKNAQIQLQRANEQLKNAQASYNQGMIAKDSMLSAESAASSAEAGKVSAQKNLELAKMNLNKLMGRSLTAPLELTTTFTYMPAEVPDVEGIVKSALALRPEVISVRETKEVAELNCKLALKYYSENTFTYRKAKIELEKAVLGVKEAEDQISLAVRSAHYAVMEAAAKLKAAQKAKEAAEEAYRVMELKYKSQMVTMADVLSAMENLGQAELAYTSAVFDYNVAGARLDNWAGKGLE
ncbi:MAG: TolC family protein [Tepidanaerobacteraceae bacterium]|jgi:outer membrane protein TolC|nr:TolC family protein [Tepidanaerobacteraceae bacterium]